jgi:exodeoxyribonuclease-5
VTAVLDFSADQEAALTRIDGWRYGRTKPFLTLGGYAGTGKSTLVNYLASCWEGAAVAALCGKAAHVLRQKGTPASTIHSLIYELVTGEGPPRFRKKQWLPGVSAVLIDEASMIDHVLLEDLLSFRLPVLFVGDHGQLEPVGTDPGLMHLPDVKLERIHRQAQGNPILRLATAFREGRDVPWWSDRRGRLVVCPRSQAHEHVRPGVQIICGYNRTRHGVNCQLREAQNFEGLVCPGELLVCLRNNRHFGVFNGQQLRVLDVGGCRQHTVPLSLATDDGRVLDGVPCAAEQFGRDGLSQRKDPKVVLCDYGYCLTAHKAQGSEWDEVLVYEEIAPKWDPRRWRYTAATRAKERLVYCA